MIGTDRPPAALARHTGFLMNWVGARSRRRFAEALGEATGLHPREFGVMSVIAADPGATQLALGERVGVDPSTMVATLDALEARGLAERRPHPSDRRKRAVHLTEEGGRALAEGRRIARRHSSELLAPLEPEEREELSRLLRKLSGADG